MNAFASFWFGFLIAGPSFLLGYWIGGRRMLRHVRDELARRP